MADQSHLSTPKPSRFFSYFLAVLVASCVTAVTTYFILTDEGGIISPLGKSIANVLPEDKPLEKYDFEHLANTNFTPSEIILEQNLDSTTQYASNVFSITVEGQKVTGQINVPTQEPPPTGFPIILMNRGFIEPQVYQTGMGTKNAAAYFASHGFVTIAPDFLGYGQSDLEDSDPMAARVKKPVTPLTILFSLESLNQFTRVDLNKVAMWGHSNGGQISLSILEILGHSPHWHTPIPTSLWAPVTAAFPYNILYYTDDFDTVGKDLRKVLFNFELKYDTDKYSIHPYLDWINSPIVLHQGTGDDLIPTSWSDRLAKVLKDKQKDISYYQYPGADHNLKPDWNVVVARDLTFFQTELEYNK